MIAQVLAPVLESVSSESSFAYRRGRGPIDAVKAAVRHGQAGCVYVADLDVLGCFDHLPHRLILARLGPLVDGEILDLVQMFLQSGVRVGGEDLLPSTAGTPQGGPLSPLLCNMVLAPLDLELEHRGHLFFRYADDIKIFLKSKTAAKRVAYWCSDYIWREFRLEVHPLRNDDGSQGKSKVIHIINADLLGFRVLPDWNLSVSGKRIPILKSRIEQRFKDDTEYPSFERKVVYLNDAVRGWCAYYRDARLPVPLLADLDEFLLGNIWRSYPGRKAGRTDIPPVCDHVSGLYGRNEETSMTKCLQEFGISGFLETFSRIKRETVRDSQKHGYVSRT
jgi:RNA-directed DNA polymerase